MATTDKQSHLEKDGIKYRNENLVRSEYNQEASYSDANAKLKVDGENSRREHLVRSDYNEKNFYSDAHEDAISDPNKPEKALGKGTGKGGYTHYTPNHELSKTQYRYDNLETINGGGCYDIHGRNDVGGRNRLLGYNLYNSKNAYGVDSVDDSTNNGQYRMKA
jgi:hypothetical protein